MMRSHTLLAYLGAIFLLSVRMIKVQGLHCYSCYGIGHPRFCDHVSQCRGNEVCGIQKYSDPSGELFFNLGCVVSDICHSKRSGPNPTKICVECCSTDICNIEGCGEHGHHNQTTSLCFNCKGLLPGEECHRVTSCDKNEVCYIEEEPFFGETSLTRGCKDKHTCGTTVNNGQIFGKRNTRNSCQKCCEGSLCNIDCAKHATAEYLWNNDPTEFRFGSQYNVTFVSMMIASKTSGTCNFFTRNNSSKIEIQLKNNTGSYFQGLTPNQIYVLQCDVTVSVYVLQMRDGFIDMYALMPNGDCSTIQCIEAQRRVIATNLNKFNFQDTLSTLMLDGPRPLSKTFIIPSIHDHEILLRVYMNDTLNCHIVAFDNYLTKLPNNIIYIGDDYVYLMYNNSYNMPMLISFQSNCYISVLRVYTSTSQPIITFIPGVDRYLSFYLFSSDSKTPIYIVIPTNFVPLLRIDTKPVTLNANNHLQFKTNFGSKEDYTIIGMDVPAGSHTVKSSKGIRFGLWTKDPSGLLTLGYST